MSIEVHFVVAQEDGKSKKFRLNNEEYVIVGRSKTLCQVYISDPLCSSTHCKVSVNNNAIFVEDLNSKNGLYLNGVKILKQRIYVDDKIRLGDCILFINHSRMDEDSVAASTYHGKGNREGNLTLELQGASRAGVGGASLKKMSEMFNPPKLSTKRVNIIRHSSLDEASIKSKSNMAQYLDILFSLILFVLINIAAMLIFPEDYTSNKPRSIFVIMFGKSAIKYTLISIIVSAMFHFINRRLPTGSLGTKLVGLN